MVLKGIMQHFKKHLCDGFLGKRSDKIDGLNQFLTRYPKSSLRDDALFELGNSYIKADNESLGFQTYDRLIEEYSRSKFAPRAMLRQGLVHYNANRNGQALSKLKAVVNKYPEYPRGQTGRGHCQIGVCR